MPVAPTLHFSEVQADAEAVEGDLVGELEANPLVGGGSGGGGRGGGSNWRTSTGEKFGGG